MKKYSRSLSIAACLFLTSCAQHVNEKPMTQLQVREMQSREFDTKDTKLVMKTMMNVLQDEGYVIKNAVLDLGLLSAEKTLDIERSGDAARATFFGGQHARWEKQMTFEASANISEFGDKTRIRMNFQVKILDNLGNLTSTQIVSDPFEYQTFFDKVSKGIFIQKENI